MDFEKVLDVFNSYHPDTKTYKGYRILAVDGTAVNMPRNTKSESYMCNKSVPKVYNQLHVTPLYDVLNKIYLHSVIQPQPRQNEVGALKFMLEWYNFEKKTLIVADRGFESYNVFAHFMSKKVDFLIRVKQERTAMREVAKLPMKELDTGQYETLATSLPRSFTLQEIFAAMIMSNFCSRIAGKVVVEKPKKNIHAYKVNWNMAVYLCKKFEGEGFCRLYLSGICIKKEGAVFFRLLHVILQGNIYFLKLYRKEWKNSIFRKRLIFKGEKGL